MFIQLQAHAFLLYTLIVQQKLLSQQCWEGSWCRALTTDHTHTHTYTHYIHTHTHSVKSDSGVASVDSIAFRKGFNFQIFLFHNLLITWKGSSALFTVMSRVPDHSPLSPPVLEWEASRIYSNASPAEFSHDLSPSQPKITTSQFDQSLFACQTNQTSPLLEKPTVSSTVMEKLCGGTYQSIHNSNYLHVTLAFERFNFKFGSLTIHSLQQQLTLIIWENGSSHRGLDL